jgi:hypothetical protein
MAAQGTSVKSEVTSQEESLEKQYSYVLHGAKTYCEYGSRTARVVVKECHGTYVHDMPVLTEEDCEAKTEIQIFGYCTCETNPDRIAKMEEILANVKKEDNLLDGIMDGVNAVGKAVKGLFGKVMSVFGKEEKKEEPEEPEFAEDLKQNVVVMCDPQFAINGKWIGGTDKLLLKGVPVLNSGCTITCIKCGGNIGLVDDGQENAISEQQGAVDFNEWEEGDGLPNLTERNIEGLAKNIAELKNKIDSCTDPAEKAKLQAELSSKQALQTTMKDNMSMVRELEESLLFSPYCEDVGGTVDQMEQSGDLQKMLDSGQLKDRNDNPITDIEGAKKYMTEHLTGSNADIRQKQKDLKVIKDSYANGTPCVKADADKMEATVTSAAAEVKSNQTKRNWADNGNALLKSGVNQNDVFNKTDNKDVVDKYLNGNQDYSMSYDSFGGQAVNESNKNDVAYIYHNGKLISQNEYNQVVKNSVGQICEANNYDWG